MSYSATVNGGLFDNTTLTPISGRNAVRRRIAQWFGKRQVLGLREIAETLNGAAAGSTASKTLGRIEANEELGGERTIETNTLVNRATTAADVAEINAYTLAFSSKTTFGASPVANLDGNPLGTR